MAGAGIVSDSLIAFVAKGTDVCPYVALPESKNRPHQRKRFAVLSGTTSSYHPKHSALLVSNNSGGDPPVADSPVVYVFACSFPAEAPLDAQGLFRVAGRPRRLQSLRPEAPASWR